MRKIRDMSTGLLLILSLLIGLFTNIGSVRAQTVNATFYDIWKDQQRGAYNEQLVSKLSIHKTKTAVQIDNPYLGIKADINPLWEYDLHFAFNYMRFFNRDFRVDVFTEVYRPEKWITKEYFYGHTLDMLRQNTKLTETDKDINGIKVKIVEYQRPKLKQMNNDLNVYTYYFIERDNAITTLQLKTSEVKKKLYQHLVEGMISHFVFYTPVPLSESDYKKASRSYADTLKLTSGKGTINVPKGYIVAGAYSENDNAFLSLSKDSGKKTVVRAVYKSITSPYDPEINRYLATGQIPMIAMLFEKAGSTDKGIMTNVIGGMYDKSILSWANGIKKTRGTVMLRIGNEMNGNWSKWGPGNYYNDPDMYQLAYNRIYTIFKNAGANNAKFIYNPNSQSSPLLTWNDTVMYYPTSMKTDLIGMTAYNYGSASGQAPSSFSNIYTPIYNEISSKFINKPLMICEVGAVEDKAAPKYQFITDAFTIPQKYFPSVRAVCWFDKDQLPYRLKLSSSKTSYEAFKKIKYIKTIIPVK